VDLLRGMSFSVFPRYSAEFLALEGESEKGQEVREAKGDCIPRGTRRVGE
jgi:hypothetical protein